jgi:CubicO group peptidase (beta-lactamase class C family)
MFPSRKFLTKIALGPAVLLILAGCETRGSLMKSRIRKVEKGLLRAVYIKGTAPEKLSLKDRMAFYKVPGVSVAIIDRYQLDWAKAYGTKDLRTYTPVMPETLFQAGSLIRPLLAAAVLSLDEKQKLPLDSEVSLVLKSWKLPPEKRSGFSAKPVTLRELLTRGAAFSGPASPGLPRKDNVPALLAVLNGLGPGPLGAKDGLAVLQQALTDQIGAPLPAIMDASVFLPLAMTHSACEVPLPPAVEASAASGHLRGGQMVEGGWLNYPVAAADGLWTTPTDYAAFLNGVVGDAIGRSATVLSASSARTLLSPPVSGGSFGYVFEGTGNDAFFHIQARMSGYTAYACYYPARGRGAVIMTNSDNGGLLSDEILRAVSAAYGWAHFVPAEKTLFRLDPSIYDQYVGRYEVTPEYYLKVSAEDYYLEIEPTGQARTKFYVESETIFFSVDPFIRIQFRRDDRGKVNGLVLWQEDFEQKAVKVR